jgi:hypothetical protein
MRDEAAAGDLGAFVGRQLAARQTGAVDVLSAEREALLLPDGRNVTDDWAAS